MFSNWVLSGRSLLQRGSRATTSAAGAILATVQHQSASSSSSGKSNRHSSTKVVSGREALLYTPGPLTTSSAVKQAMLRDYGSRDPTFIRVVREIEQELLKMAHVSRDQGYECVIQQGSGTFVVESVLSSVVPPPAAGGRILVVSNGFARGFNEDQAPDPARIIEEVKAHAEAGKKFSHVAVVHHETTAGVLNPVNAIGNALKVIVGSPACRAADPSITFIVDSMSGFEH
eukprot:gene16934-27556_t